jgi:transmembrane sensor
MNTVDTAAAWFAKQQSGAMTRADREALVDWLAVDEANRTAWATMQTTWSVLGAARDESSIAELRTQALASVTPRRSHWQWGLAATVVLAFGAVLLTREQDIVGSETSASLARFETQIGERVTHVLADGSQVTLNTNTELRVIEWDKSRRIAIDRGQAFFVVAKDAAKPFIVEVGNARVTAVGTQFDVRREAQNIAVALTEGRVRLSQQGAQAVEMSAGSVATIANSDAWQVQVMNTQALTSWRDGRLIFEGEPLARVVAELNRYSHTQLSIADAALKTLPISGVFRTGDVTGFARALQAYGVASANTNEATIELSAVK